MTKASTPDAATKPPRARDPLYTSIVGLTSIAIMLQGLWAGLFIREGKDYDQTSSQADWVKVHDWGARAAIVLALIALVVAAVRLRHRRDLLVGTLVLFLALILEAYLGGGIGDHPDWPSYHIPLALILVSLSVWLPFRATRR